MNDLKVFESEEFGKVRVLEINGEPHFVGKDVAENLGYQNGSRDINRHVDEEDRRKTMVFDGRQNKETIIINESGLYSLILSSKLPNAKKFKRWVTSEILPTIRKTGNYSVKQQYQPTDYEIRQQQLEEAKLFQVLANKYTGTFSRIMDCYTTKALSGEFLLPLPKLQEKTYSATQIGNILGITASKVGKISNSLNLKNENYGVWVLDKAKHSQKEIQSFRYYENAVDVIKNYIKDK